MSTSPADETMPADAVVPLLRTLGDADAAVCADGVCAVPAATDKTTDETRGADE